jgi:tRNA G46 methylase TrmB
VAGYINALAARVMTATVSYVGKANYQEAERYIRDFRAWTSSAADGLTIEISAVNGRFTLDFLQTFSSPVFVNAFLKELEENGIVYDLQDVNELELPNIKLPWTE